MLKEFQDARRDNDGRIVSIECPNCCAVRYVDENGIAEECIFCGDDGIDIYDSRSIP